MNAVVNAPTDPVLGGLWRLAMAKFSAKTGALPSTTDEWNTVTRDYAVLTSKPHGSLRQIIREVCRMPGHG
jgi:hypothetical protein